MKKSKIKSIMKFLEKKPSMNMSILGTWSGSLSESNEATLIIHKKQSSCEKRATFWPGSGSRSNSNETTQIICKWTCKIVINVANLVPAPMNFG
jgi:hypothetical protein